MDNKEKILETALDLFYAKGYDAVGVQEIAEKSGVTKPTLYHYYGSKYGLLESLIKTYYEEFEKDINLYVKCNIYRLTRRCEKEDRKVLETIEGKYFNFITKSVNELGKSRMFW